MTSASRRSLTAPTSASTERNGEHVRPCRARRRRDRRARPAWASFSADLIAQGARVAVIDQVECSGSDARRTCARADGRPLKMLVADVTQRAALEAALAEIEKAWGRALWPRQQCRSRYASRRSGLSENGPFETYSESSFDRVMDVNVKGAFLCCQVFGGAMARAGRGSIVNVGSIYGVLAPDQALYQYRRQRRRDVLQAGRIFRLEVRRL